MRKIHRNLKNGKEKIKRVFTRTTGEFKGKFKGMQHGIIAYARKNPLKTVGLSVLAGVLISNLRRLRR